MTILLFLNPSCVLGRVHHVNFGYYWLVSMVNQGSWHRYANIHMDAMITQPKPYFWHPTKIKLTTALFLNTFCMFKWVINANFCYYWLVSMVNHGNPHSCINTGVNAMATQPKPSFWIKQNKIDHCIFFEQILYV